MKQKNPGQEPGKKHKVNGEKYLHYFLSFLRDCNKFCLFPCFPGLVRIISCENRASASKIKTIFLAGNIFRNRSYYSFCT